MKEIKLLLGNVTDNQEEDLSAPFFVFLSVLVVCAWASKRCTVYQNRSVSVQRTFLCFSILITAVLGILCSTVSFSP